MYVFFLGDFPVAGMKKKIDEKKKKKKKKELQAAAGLLPIFNMHWVVS